MTKQQGLTNRRFQEGDASDLYEVKDQTFDLVVSIVGAMFAPKPFDVDGQNKSASRDTTSIPATFLGLSRRRLSGRATAGNGRPQFGRFQSSTIERS
jgi:hypothetical protein